MRLKFGCLLERARRRDEEQAAASAAMRALATLPYARWRAWLRAHPAYATSSMVAALTEAAKSAAEDVLTVLNAAAATASMLRDDYDGPWARYVVWSARGAVLCEWKRYSEALIAFDRAGAELDDAPEAFAAPFRADLALDRATLLMKMGDPIAARQSAWAAADWYGATGERAGLARIAMIVVAASANLTTDGHQ